VLQRQRSRHHSHRRHNRLRPLQNLHLGARFLNIPALLPLLEEKAVFEAYPLLRSCQWTALVVGEELQLSLFSWMERQRVVDAEMDRK